MSDLVERLAKLSEQGEVEHWEIMMNLLIDASTGITRLRALNAELVEALDDLLSWFPDKTSESLWLIKAGKYGADDAIDAARAALSKAKGEA